MPGLFITFEGGEGSGKSTAVKNLSRWFLSEFGIVPVILREPGGTKLGEEIREILLHKDLNLTPLAEAFLFQAPRAQLVKEVIRPALMQEKVVLLDRYIDSTDAYQGWARQIGVENTRILNEISTEGLIPNLTFLLDIDPEIGLRRRKADGKTNRIDKEDPGFHERVRYAYLREAERDKTGRWAVIDASLSIEEINKTIRETTKTKINELKFLEGQMKGKER